MISRAYKNGVEAASKRFGVREASLMDLILGVGTPMAVRAGANVLAPKLVPTIEKSLEAPFRVLKDTGRSALTALRGPQTPADALVHALSQAPSPGPIPGMHTPSGVIGRMGPR
jgi:hypothetical protein